MTAPTPIPVACAIITDKRGLVLVAQRPPGKHLALQWEFPGGKIEPGESPAAALAREIREELGCAITVDRALPPYVHHYEKVTIEMHPFLCRLTPDSPRPRAHEHAAIGWARVTELPDYDFAAADLPVVWQIANEGLKTASQDRFATGAGFRGLAGLLAAACWIALIALHPQALFLQRTSATLWLVPVTGALLLACIADLRAALRGERDVFDEVCLAVAAAPGLTLLAAFAVRLLGFSGLRFLDSADWGMLLVFPGIMLAGTVLIRHRLLRSWNWLPSLIGLSLPVGLFSHQAGWRQTAMIAAMLPAAGWLVLGAATRQAARSARINRPKSANVP